MKVKEREDENFFYYLKETFKFIYKGIINKKTKIISLTIIFLILFLIGIFSGLLISKFFGTFDNPSLNILKNS